MKKIPYLIISPPYYPSSAGVRMMHALCHYLNESGYEVIRFTNEEVSANVEAVVQKIKDILDKREDIQSDEL